MRESSTKSEDIGVLLPKEIKKTIDEKWSIVVKKYGKMLQKSLTTMRPNLLEEHKPMCIVVYRGNFKTA